MDVVVHIRKVDSSGNPLTGPNFPCSLEIPEVETCKLYGPQGFLRAFSTPSRDNTRSRPDGQEVFYRHDCEQKIHGADPCRIHRNQGPGGDCEPIRKNNSQQHIDMALALRSSFPSLFFNILRCFLPDPISCCLQENHRETRLDTLPEEPVILSSPFIP